jgi:hypothetical protein
MAVHSCTIQGMISHPKKILIRRHVTTEEADCLLASLIPIGIRYPAEKIINKIPNINATVFVSFLGRSLIFNYDGGNIVSVISVSGIIFTHKFKLFSKQKRV